MPRRVYDYLPLPEYIVMNQIASVGAMIIGVSMALWIFNMIYSSAKGKDANMDDPWELGGKYYWSHQAKTPHH